MIGQYLSNNNENNYSAILQKFSHLNQPWMDRLDLVAVGSTAGHEPAAKLATGT
jgi:hypothetical protein